MDAGEHPSRSGAPRLKRTGAASFARLSVDAGLFDLQGRFSFPRSTASLTTQPVGNWLAQAVVSIRLENLKTLILEARNGR
jgi:hypothetical protein